MLEIGETYVLPHKESPFEIFFKILNIDEDSNRIKGTSSCNKWKDSTFVVNRSLSNFKTLAMHVDNIYKLLYL